MKKLFYYLKKRWEAETPARAKMIKALFTWIAGASVTISLGFEAMPASLQNYLPQGFLTFVAGFAFLGRIVAGLTIVKGGNGNEKTSQLDNKEVQESNGSDNQGGSGK
jgi:hypothetical protein